MVRYDQIVKSCLSIQPPLTPPWWAEVGRARVSTRPCLLGQECYGDFSWYIAGIEGLLLNSFCFARLSFLFLQREEVFLVLFLLVYIYDHWHFSCQVVHRVAKSPTRLSDFTLTFHFHALEKEMATHSSVLSWRIPGTGEPGGLPSMGSHRVGHK